MSENSSNVVESEEFIPEVFRGDDYFAAGCILVIASSGIFINLYNVSYYLRDPQSITYFIRARIISDIIVSSVFLTYVLPVVLFALTDVCSGWWNRISDLLASWAYLFIVMLEPIVATNRLIAIFSPISYERIFSKSFTMICILSACILSSGGVMPDIFGVDCVYSFDYTWLAWSYPLSPCGKAAETYAFLLPAYICNGTTFIINLIICLRLVLLEFVSNQATSTSKRKNAHIRFFIQSCLQFFVFLIDLCMNTFFEEPESRLITFVYYSLIWMSLHTIDGFIIYIFRSKSVKERKEWRSVHLRSRAGSSVSQIVGRF